MVYQDVTRNKNLSAASKGLYAYLASFCGADDECYPSVDMILSEMGMVKDTFYKHINALVAAGVVTKCQNVGKDGRFGKTVYRLTHTVEIHDFPNTKKQESDSNGFPFPKNKESGFSTADKQETNNNNININSINNNSNNINSASSETRIAPAYPYQEIISYLNEKAGTNFRSASKATQKHIRARFKEGFTLKDFKTVINVKVAEWKGGELEKYLRPETLFGTKFESYLNQKRGSSRKPNSFHNFQERDYDFTALQEQLVNQDAPHPDAAAGTGEGEHYEPE